MVSIIADGSDFKARQGRLKAMIGVETRRIDSWVLNQRVPNTPGPNQLILLLHGWTGDEKVMWIFTSRLPKDSYLISPRGIYATSIGGFGWHKHEIGQWPTLGDLRPAVDALTSLMTPENFPDAKVDKFHIIGFSQGAALGFAFSLLNPQRILSMAGLSGFLPRDIGTYLKQQALKDLPIFLAHGTRDKLVPVEKARQAIHDLQLAGADVAYCEDDVGHKLSVTCFNSLEHFSALQFST